MAGPTSITPVLRLGLRIGMEEAAARNRPRLRKRVRSSVNVVTLLLRSDAHWPRATSAHGAVVGDDGGGWNYAREEAQLAVLSSSSLVCRCVFGDEEWMAARVRVFCEGSTSSAPHQRHGRIQVA